MDVQRHLDELDTQGYTVIADFLCGDALERVRAQLAKHLDSHSGRNNFEGFLTERVYTLVGRGRCFEDIAEDARVLALLDALLAPGYLLTASQAICIRPGETPQPIHHDDSFYPIAAAAAVDQLQHHRRGRRLHARQRRHRGHPRQPSLERRADRRHLRRPRCRCADAAVAREPAACR